MSTGKKGISAALTVIITLVVLITVGLAIVTIVTGGLGDAGANTAEVQRGGFGKIVDIINDTETSGVSGSSDGRVTSSGGSGGSGGGSSGDGFSGSGSDVDADDVGVGT